MSGPGLVSWVLLVLLALAAPAEARVVHVLVYADANRDGRPSVGEPGVAGVVVAFGVAAFVVTNARGEIDLDLADELTPIVWVRVPDGYEPGPVWSRVADGADSVDLGLRPLATPVLGPITFVVAADTHIWEQQQYFGSAELAVAAAEATASHPAFFTILGDLTQGDQPSEFDLVDAGLASLDVPFVPVPGNHDWYDGGASWKAHYGPDNYSFDIERVHFVVWNLAMSDDAVRAFLGAELAHVDKDMTIVVLTHAPPDEAVIEVLREQGVSYLLTGHTHTNRSFDHGGLIELNTEPLVMGGLDFTPAGYRVVTIDHGQLTSSHHTVIDEPSVEVVAPRPGGCVEPTGGSLIIATELDGSTAMVTAWIDGGSSIALTHVGGWSWRAPLPELASGGHALAIEARSLAGVLTTRTMAIETCRAETGPEIGADWPQLGGGADHVGARPCELGPPLAVRWTQTVGGHALQAAPVVAAGVVYMTATDLGDGNGGGLAAIDLATGAIRWRIATSMPVRGSPAVIGSTVVIARVDGRVLGFDVATGAERWHADLGAGLVPQAAAIFASVATDAGDVLVGNQRAFGPLSAASGTPKWRVDPVLVGRDSQSFSAAAVADGTVIGVFNRRLGGVIAWDRTTGNERWRVDAPYTVAINATPIVAHGAVYVVNGRDEVIALDLLTGKLRWKQVLDPAGFDWGNATVGAPAYANGVLIVPTLYRDVVALDSLTGAERWRFAGRPSQVHTTHYRGAKEAGFEASPVITGEIVWVVDTSGELTALELATGKAIWRTALGVPVLAGAAVSGEWLVIASYDGTVRAFAPAAPHVLPASCPAVAFSGGCCDSGDAGSSTALAVVIAMLMRRAFRTSCRRTRTCVRAPATTAAG